MYAAALCVCTHSACEWQPRTRTCYCIQVLGCLSAASQVDPVGDLEWWMHYQIPALDLPRFFAAELEVKPSLVPRSQLFPDMNPGQVDTQRHAHPTTHTH